MNPDSWLQALIEGSCLAIGTSAGRALATLSAEAIAAKGSWAGDADMTWLGVVADVQQMKGVRPVANQVYLI